MPAGNAVRPGKWTNVIDLYDDGDNSAIWGIYDGGRKCLGVRWNGDEGSQGFPNQGNNPLWYVEPEFVTRYILLKLLNNVIVNLNLPNRDLYIRNLQLALQECQC